MFSLDPAQFDKRSKKVRVDWCKERLEKYDGDVSKYVYKIVTGNESSICAYEPEKKQQSSVGAFEPQPNATKVICEKITSK